MVRRLRRYTQIRKAIAMSCLDLRDLCNLRTNFRPGLVLFFSLILSLGPLSAVATAADDLVILSSASNPQSRSRITGKVIDFTGREITVETTGGTQRKYPADQVVEVQTAWPAGMTEGDALLAKRQYSAAYLKYKGALDSKQHEEQRDWVRRKLLARMVTCLRHQKLIAQAGEFFLLLLRADPTTLDFDVVPLAWLPGEPPADVEQKAREWLDREDSPVAVLMGASHLLSTAQGPAALAKLEQLTADKDVRIAALAEAQIWRGTFVTATPEQVALWQQRVERLPESLRAGPYLVLGRALLYGKMPDEAALALLRVPILFPAEPALAAEALTLAAQALEQAGHTDGAARVRRERDALTTTP